MSTLNKIDKYLNEGRTKLKKKKLRKDINNVINTYIKDYKKEIQFAYNEADNVFWLKYRDKLSNTMEKISKDTGISIHDIVNAFENVVYDIRSGY